MSLFEVRAAEGRRVRNPATGQPIPGVADTDAEPVAVAMDSYWGRRVADGDVVAMPFEPKPVKTAKE